MAGLTRYAQKKLLDHLLGIASYTMPSAVYLALFTDDPTELGTQTSELVGSGYARRPLAGIMSATSLANGQSTNASLIILGPATAAWSLTQYGGVIDAVTGGNMLIYGPLTTAMLVQAGDSPPIYEGSLVLTLD